LVDSDLSKNTVCNIFINANRAPVVQVSLITGVIIGVSN
jgi:hypothetical protein